MIKWGMLSQIQYLKESNQLLLLMEEGNQERLTHYLENKDSKQEG